MVELMGVAASGERQYQTQNQICGEQLAGKNWPSVKKQPIQGDLEVGNQDIDCASDPYVSPLAVPRQRTREHSDKIPPGIESPIERKAQRAICAMLLGAGIWWISILFKKLCACSLPRGACQSLRTWPLCA